MGLRGVTHATRDRVAKTPFFLEHLLSGTDNGRVKLIEARSGLGSVGNYRTFQHESSSDLRTPLQMRDQG